jgi:hypothetical protein
MIIELGKVSVETKAWFLGGPTLDPPGSGKPYIMIGGNLF